MVYTIGLMVVSALTLASIALYKYGKIQTQHILVTLTILTAWSFSFLIVFIIPLDITATVYRQCVSEHNITKNIAQKYFNDSVNIQDTHECQKPAGMIPDDMFPNVWRIIYWSSQFLTWLIMPLMQSYLKAGEFTIKGKLKSALIDNAIYYGTYLLLCGILLIYLTLKPEISLDWQQIKAIASSASNTWGLFLLVLLLGYALVEIPRNLWYHSQQRFALQYAYFKISKLSNEEIEAEDIVNEVLEQLHEASRTIPNNHEIRPYVETILRKVPTELLEKISRNAHQRNGGITSTVIPSEKALSRLHTRVIKSLQILQRIVALWNVELKRAFHLEDVGKNRNSTSFQFISEFPVERTRLQAFFYNSTIHWYWECRIKTPFLKTLSIIAAIFSLIIAWSELTFFCGSPVLSIFARVLNVAKKDYDFFTIETFSMVTLWYLCYCAFSTVFRIKFLNLYYLAPHHQTNEHSLIFCGMLLCRLTPPLCLNYLGLVHMDSHIIKQRILETYYTQIMGHMDVLDIISDGFNIYFPMVILAICFATWFNLGSRTLNALGFQQFMLNETLSTELVQDGRNIVARIRRRRQRLEESMARRRDNQLNQYTPKYRSGSGGGGGVGGGIVGTGGNLAGNFTGQNGYSGRLQNTNIIGPGDGLLRDADPIDYSTSNNTNINHEISRSLSDEINERFGSSTGYRTTYDIPDSDNSDDDIGGTDNNIASGMDSIRNYRKTGQPPRGLFDDV